MDAQSNGSATQPVRNGAVEGVKFSGWVYRYVPGGLFRKKWIKKWAVLMDERIYLYESQSINNNDTKNSSHVVNLLQCEQCGEPETKELKKNPNLFQLEMQSTYAPDPKKKKKATQKQPRELFNVENEAEKTRWLEKLNEAIVAAKKAEKTSLDHVTKTRPKPRAVQRRPPSRHHIRQLATQSQLLPGDVGFDSNPDPELAPTSNGKGTVPTTALKPPMLKVTEQSKDRENATENAPEENIPAEEKPVPTPRRRTTLTPSVEEEDGESTSASRNSPIPPPTPSKSLKPKLVLSTDDVARPPESSESGASTPVLPHVLPLKFPLLKPTAAPRSTRSLDRRDLFEGAKSRSTSFAGKPGTTASMPRQVQIKGNAIKLPVFPESKSSLVSHRGKSRSMTLLDKFDDLPPPPVPPPAESVSDIELSSENLRARSMENLRPRKKKPRRVKRSPSNANTADEDE